MKEQRRITLTGRNIYTRDHELDKLLKNGWYVVNMCPFAEPVALNYAACLGVGEHGQVRGSYAVIVIVEKD